MIVEGTYFHVRHGTHISNLVVHEGLTIINGSLNKIILCVKYIRGIGPKIKVHTLFRETLKCNF